VYGIGLGQIDAEEERRMRFRQLFSGRMKPALAPDFAACRHKGARALFMTRQGLHGGVDRAGQWSTMASPFARLASLAAAGRPFGVATVVRTQGSTPQTVGARLFLPADGDQRPSGTLGGGCVEADALLALADVLAGAPPAIREYRLTEELAWNTGLVCGGTMWILAEAGQPAATIAGRSLVTEIEAAVAGRAPMALVTRVIRRDGAFVLAGRMAVLPRGRLVGDLGDVALTSRAAAAAEAQIARGPAARVVLAEGDEILIEPIVPRPRLVIAGGGHVARAIARQARLVDFDVTILEDRPEYADPDRFEGARVVRGDVAASLASLDLSGQTFVVVATRGHKMDADCVLAAARTAVPYIGLLGSRRKRVLVADMLREAGVDESRLAAIRAPVGLDLGGRTPAEIALSVLAEITRFRYGKDRIAR
jgi:xanthine dehydrogenase accessory factor